MRKFHGHFLAFALFCSSFIGWQPVEAASNSKPADLIFKNGSVYTVDEKRSWAEAVAVKDGEILYVGNDEGVAAYKGTDTRVIDLKGKMLLPGFIDSHNHAYLMAESLFWLSLNPYSTVEARQQAIRDYVKEHPESKQLRGVGWDQIKRDSEARGLAPKELFDQVVTDIPAVFITNDHHSMLVNSKALEIAGINKNTPDPEGGTIERDPETGEPTGVLHEFSAQNLVINALPQPDFTVEQYKETILTWQDVAAEDGITSTFVPVHYPTENLLKAFEDLDNTGKLTVRYDLGLWADETKGTEQIGRLKELRDNYQGNSYKVDSIKIFSDGVGENKLVWDQAVLEKIVAALDKEGFRVYVHAIGNQGFYPSHNALDAFAYAAKANGKRDSRHVITHLDWVREDDVARFKDLGVIPAPQPAWFGKDWYADVSGEWLKELNHMNSYFQAGIPVTSSSDFPSTTTFQKDMYPLTGLEVGVTRLDPDKATEADLNKAVWPKEKASLEDMIASYTINGAHLIFAEEERGSIEVGKKADLVVLENNLFKIPITKVSETKVLLTLFEGKEVFRHPSLSDAELGEQGSSVIAFTDIAGHWAESDIKRAAAKGLLSDYPDVTFKPDTPVTRAEFTAMLEDALKLASAAQEGIVDSSEDGSFRSDANITRAEMAVMIARAMKLSPDTNATTGFADDEAIPQSAKGAVESLRQLGIVDGRGGNRFAPNETATRAETIVMLLRMQEQKGKQ